MDPSIQNTMYTPIETAAGSLGTRILELQPGKPGTTICCDLHNIQLDTARSYEALSYVWGTIRSERSIQLRGTDWKVTSSLEGILGRLRHVDTSRFLWIDALCIDQTNVIERGEQVQIMDQIYKNASQVLIWLGQENDTTRLAFLTMDEILTAARLRLWKYCSKEIGLEVQELTPELITEFCSTGKSKSEADIIGSFPRSKQQLAKVVTLLHEYDNSATLYNDTLPAQTASHFLKDNKSTNSLSESIQDLEVELEIKGSALPISVIRADNVPRKRELEELLLRSSTPTYEEVIELQLAAREDAWCDLLRDREWWFRMWTIQEYIFTSNAVLMCDRYELSVDLALLASEILLSRYSADNGLLSRLWRRLYNLHELQALKMKAGEPLPLHSLLQQFSLRQSTDPRDKIYGLLNLSDGAVASVKPDYTMSTAETFITSSRAILKHSGALHLLCGRPEMCRLPEDWKDPLSEQLPSWVPRYDLPLEWWYSMHTNKPPVLKPRLSLPHVSGEAEQADVDYKALPIICTRFDKIRLIGACFEYLNPKSKELWEKVREIAPGVNAEYVSGEKAIEAYWRTLLLNRFNRGQLIQGPDTRVVRKFFEDASDIHWDSSGVQELCDERGIHQWDLTEVRFYEVSWWAMNRKTFCWTEKGYMTLVDSEHVNIGDEVCVADGCYAPLILRAVEKKISGSNLDTYEFVSSAYVQYMVSWMASCLHLLALLA